MHIRSQKSAVHSISEGTGDARTCGCVRLRPRGKPQLLAMLAKVLPALTPGAMDVGRLRAKTALLIPSKAEPEGEGVVASSGVELVAGMVGSDKAVVGAALLDPFSCGGRTEDNEVVRDRDLSALCVFDKTDGGRGVLGVGACASTLESEDGPAEGLTLIFPK